MKYIPCIVSRKCWFLLLYNASHTIVADVLRPAVLDVHLLAEEGKPTLMPKHICYCDCMLAILPKLWPMLSYMVRVGQEALVHHHGHGQGSQVLGGAPDGLDTVTAVGGGTTRGPKINNLHNAMISLSILFITIYLLPFLKHTDLGRQLLAISKTILKHLLHLLISILNRPLHLHILPGEHVAEPVQLNCRVLDNNTNHT